MYILQNRVHSVKEFTQTELVYLLLSNKQ